jgi:hypothetical protein
MFRIRLVQPLTLLHANMFATTGSGTAAKALLNVLAWRFP